MPLFVAICTDKPNSLDLRMATRPAHLAYIGGPGSPAQVGGPMLKGEDQPKGSIAVFEAETQAEVEAFLADDPYAKAGLFESVVVHPWRIALGSLA
jgi:uncharacterized protein YciI